MNAKNKYMQVNGKQTNKMLLLFLESTQEPINNH